MSITDLSIFLEAVYDGTMLKFASSAIGDASIRFSMETYNMPTFFTTMQ